MLAGPGARPTPVRRNLWTVRCSKAFVHTCPRGPVDALHLAAAIRLDVDAILTYDRRISEAAESLGMKVVAPA